MNIETLVNKNDIITGMMTYRQIVNILTDLQIVLEEKIEGDIVELGCNIGTTSMYIRKLLDYYKTEKDFHVYDSWQGLPKKSKYDNSGKPRGFVQGECKTSKENFIQTFKSRNLKLPIIHTGWFSEIPDNEYPSKICFAFFDGDFYTSIMDSFNKIYDKVQKGGRFIIDDCGWEILPGVECACRAFLNSKLEILDLTGYSDENGVYGKSFGGGRVIKL